MNITINENLRLELRPGADEDWGVVSIVPTRFGGDATNLVFWSKSENEARAFIQGAQMMNNLNL